jgi:hypothetical protein
MAGFPMVQPTPFVPRKPGPHRNIYCCKYCKELRLAASVQHSANKRNVEMMIVLLGFLYFAPFAYFVLTGSETWFVVWASMMFLALLVGGLVL